MSTDSFCNTTCEECDVTFNTLNGYKIHMRKIHDTNETNSYTCQICNHKTPYKSNYNRHFKTCSEKLKNNVQEQISVQLVSLQSRHSQDTFEHQKCSASVKALEEKYNFDFEQIKAEIAKLKAKIDTQALIIDAFVNNQTSI
jgi:hypothetical protein